LVVAASRDQALKVYVQNKLGEHSAEVWKMLKRGAYIYISGSSGKMPKAVRETLKDVVKAGGRMTEEEATEYMQNMENAGRLQEETWS